MNSNLLLNHASGSRNVNVVETGRKEAKAIRIAMSELYKVLKLTLKTLITKTSLKK
jgi:hypothetical protein